MWFLPFFVSLCTVPQSAAIPMFISSIAKTAAFEQRTISAAEIRSIPPPMQYPWTATITGILHVCSIWKHFCYYSRNIWKRMAFLAGSSLYFPKTFPKNYGAYMRSSPAQKCLPFALRRIALTLGSRLAWLKDFPSYSTNFVERAFSFDGRFRVRVNSPVV